MEFNELVQALEKLNVQIIMQTIEDGNVLVIFRENQPIAHLLHHKINEFYTGYDKFNDLTVNEQQKITELLQAFSNTPVSAR
ncbi:hypothetical protein HZY86_07215 [Aerococcaceae bacterium DSM 111020]|nr:hypothetical protein [Aerococcaceae bacterium DSM 111020]